MKDHRYALDSYQSSNRTNQIDKLLNNFGYLGILDLLIFLEDLKESKVLDTYDFTCYNNISELLLHFSTIEQKEKFYSYLGYDDLYSFEETISKLNIRYIDFTGLTSIGLIFDYSHLPK